MSHEPVQNFLFGDAEAVEDDLARHELRLLAWNLQSPSLERVRRQLTWMYETRSNVLVLTEVKLGDGAAHLAKDLDSNGFTVLRPAHGPDDRYVNVIATKGYDVRPVALPSESPRFSGARLSSHAGELDVVALYSLTNGMTVQSSRSRAAFQQDVLRALAVRLRAEPDVPLLVAGDFNVLEPGHIPSSDLFEEHDYAFYRGLEQLGLLDAYRRLQPDGTDLSWYGPQGGQRLDHAFTSPVLAGRLTECGFDHTARTTRLSDHSALTLTLGEVRS